MSVVRGFKSAQGQLDGEKIVLPERADVLEDIQRRWAGDDPHRWRTLAALVLHTQCGFTLGRLGLMLGIHRGNVHRRIARCKRDLRRLLTEGA